MWKTINSYFWWTHPRGSFHYDVMVTLILAFIFISPHYINFRDKPAVQTMHPTQVGSVGNETEYLVSAAEINDLLRNNLLKKNTPTDVPAAIARALQPISGNAPVERYEPLHDQEGNIDAYRVFVKK
jgi:hypothetical protein